MDYGSIFADLKKQITEDKNKMANGRKEGIMFLGIMIILAIAVSAVWLLSNAIFKIPAYHYGILERFGERIGGPIEEGLGFKIPFIDEIELVSLELGELDVTASFTTKDKLQLAVRGSLQYRPDPTISDADEKNIFITMSEDIIRSGIEDAIQSLLGGLGGIYNAVDFIKNRQALADMLNAILRIGTPPHLKHKASNCGVQKCKMADKIEAKDLIKYYNKHWKKVREVILLEEHNAGDHSSTEKRYGIDVKAFTLSQVDFSEETKKSFEKQKQAEARGKAFDTKIAMAQKVVALGASAQVALNAADVSLDPEVKKNVVSVEGEAGVLGGVLANLKGGTK